MNIIKTDVDALNAILNVKIEKADYEEKLDKALRDLRKKVSLKGFRPGMVPTGLIKKMYGKSTLVEEVNKILSDSLWHYIVDNKLHILGEPLPVSNNLNDIELDSMPDFEFSFEIGLAPEVNIEIKDEKVNTYSISIDDETFNNYKNYYARTYGNNVPVEESSDNSIMNGKIIQTGVEEEPIVNENAKLLVSMIKDEEIKAMFLGKKAGESIQFDIQKALESDVEIAGLLNKKKEELNLSSTVFEYTINEITNFVEAECNQDLWDKIYGKDNVTSEEQYFEKIREDIAVNYKAESEYKLSHDIRHKLLEKASFELPDEFLKKWLKTSNQQEITDEILEKEYPLFKEDIRWQLIKDSFIRKHDLKVTEEGIKALAKQVAAAQFRQYGINDVPEEHLEEMAGRILSNEKEKKRLEEKKTEDIVIDFVKESINLEVKEITPEEFRKLQN